jgi:PhzF family phenazine biosynthesis protein
MANMKNMNVHTLLCFGAGPGDGNPALVIEGDRTDAAARQACAQARNTTCVFIDENEDEDEAIRVDYFYPHMRSPLCLHATLAVAAVLFARPGQAQDAELAVQTALKGQRLVLTRAGSDYFVRLAPQPAPALEIDAIPLAALLDVPGFEPVARPRLASVGSPKLLVQVADTAALHALAPDLPAIVDWGRASGVNGLYVWCRRADGACEGRNFNHLDPALEDSATGVAAGALSVALGGDLVLYQGQATGRHCLIRTRLDGATLLVGSKAIPAAVDFPGDNKLSVLLA